MEWKEWNGKKIFVQLKSSRVYSGKVIDVDITSGELIFITIIDKFGLKVSFPHTEIVRIKEEE